MKLQNDGNQITISYRNRLKVFQYVVHLGCDRRENGIK